MDTLPFGASTTGITCLNSPGRSTRSSVAWVEQLVALLLPAAAAAKNYAIRVLHEKQMT